MTYTIEHDPEMNIIFITVEGEFDLAVMRQVAASAAQLAGQTGCHRILNDLRRAALTKDIIAIYQMPKVARQEGISQYIKRALVVTDTRGDMHFLETVFLNQGHGVQLFTSLSAAIDWLQQ